jgi:hypothetical protein
MGFWGWGLGFGLTRVATFPKFGMGSFSFDAMYYADIDPSGYGAGDMFISPIVLGELDYFGSSLHPWIQAGLSAEGTLGQPQGGGYTIYYYY